ncbi:MAG: O-antigen ligase family protein [Flavobacterium sp.]|uniref:O-antigen ligase family protein n=1 Tax=Flavobacterium sp. TaxID=239 RepID=UPI0022CA66E5|nr:O-antigen ligase family protein [Flavobacterium sp.]MCZ8197454.1 O-antigen ligase family protein [Flavobacterium sp.]
MSLEDIFLKVRRVFLITLIFAFILGFFETLYTVFGIGKAKSIIELLNYFPFVEKDIFLDRISSIGNEPPDLALFLISTCSWMLSYIYTEKSIGKYLPTIMILFLTYYSGSRTALIVIFIQLSIFLYIITPKQQFFLIVQKGVLIIFSLSLILVIFESDKVLKSVENKIESLNFKKNLTKNISNQSRFGIQYASLQVFKDNPIIGVGYGQQSFYSRNYYPGWAKKRNYEFKELYENSAVKSFPPAYNIYTRVLAETGIVGFCILLYFIIYVLYSLNKHLRIHNKDNFVLILILYTTLFGLFLYWLQNDTFKIYVLWLSIAIFIKIKQEKIIKNHDTEKNSK